MSEAHALSPIEQHLRKGVEKTPDATAVIWNDREYTYTDLYSECNRVSSAMRSAGLTKGDRVALMMTNSIEYVVSWFGAIRQGIVVIPVNPALRGEGLHHILTNSDSNYLIVDGDLAQHIDYAAVPLIREVVVNTHDEHRGAALPTTDKPVYTYDEFLAKGSPDDFEFTEPVSPKDVESVLYTSGTTGLPKGVVQRQGRFAMAAAVAAMKPGQTMYVFLPLFHIAAQTTMVAALAAGARILLRKRFSASAFEPDCEKYHVDAFIIVGGIIPIIMKTYEHAPPPTFELDRILVGAPWSPYDQPFQDRYKIKNYIRVYTTTEGGAVLVGPPGTPPKAVGKPLGGVITIFDENDNELGPGEVGELVYRPGAKKEAQVDYYNNEEAGRKKTAGGWQRSGDLFYKDEQGFFYFVDRKDHWIRRRGENISPTVIENALNQHAKVQESAVVGVPAEFGEDEVLAIVVPKKDEAVTAEELVTWLDGKVAAYEIPRYIAFSDGFEKTGTERIKKYLLTEDLVDENGKVYEHVWDRQAES